jgi:hypothetical protein
MQKKMGVFIIGLCMVLFCIFTVAPVHAKEKPAKGSQPAPTKTIQNIKEYGAYIKLTKGYVRLLPNIVFDEKDVFFIEPNNPPHFFLKDMEYLVVYGEYQWSVLTVNPMGFYQPSPLGKLRFAFGKEIGIDAKPQGKDMFILKPKGLLARGYYSIWVNDTAWDFILD